ncbi:MAG: von Willebrand factor type A domain-containing protein [Bdellovibrionaceae bacterium]|nr:von Willebrand factor type A domain-containing protein [Pseudobdellovibrionaceae bacterium]
MNNSNNEFTKILETYGPQLTAYALGELSETEGEALMKEIGDHPQVKTYLQQMKTLHFLVHETIPHKTSLQLTDSQKNEVLNARPQEAKGKWSLLKHAFKSQLFVPALSLSLLLVISLVFIAKTQRSLIDQTIDIAMPEESYYHFSPPPQEERSLEAQTTADVEQVAPSQESPPPSPQLAQQYSFQNKKILGKVETATGRAHTMEAEVNAKKVSGDYAPSGFGRTHGLLPHYGCLGYGCLPPNTHVGGSYLSTIESTFRMVSDEPLSTFSLDVDTSAYTQARALLMQNYLPPEGLMRTEEFVNYFRYTYPEPKVDKPLRIDVELTRAPWNEAHLVARVGLKARQTPISQRPANNFVFLIDVSGSMIDENKLPLVKKSLQLLTTTLREQDRIAIVTYAGATEVVLPATSGSQKKTILEAIDRLNADGSTNGQAGIDLAYEIANINKTKNSNNRVILATDGDFNMGITDENVLEKLIERKAKDSNVFLTILGYGMDNYQDSRMQKLANKGNGNNYYIDSLREAKKVLIDQGVGTLNTVAKDAKIQVEFNPLHVQSYRLIGYEKRKLNNEDFNNDQKDAGDIGEGHTVTALYEIVPADGKKLDGVVDPLKYQQVQTNPHKELMTIKLRYKEPRSEKSELLSVPVANVITPLHEASHDTQFALAVAGYTMVIKKSQHKGSFDLNKVQALAEENLTVEGTKDLDRVEFVELIKQTRYLQSQPEKVSSFED